MKIKNIHVLLLAISGCIPLVFTSCSDYLDVDKYFTDVLNADTLFNRKHYAEQWLWYTYSHLNKRGAEIANKGHESTSFTFASDEAIYGDWDDLCEKYQNGEYTAANQLQEDRWSLMFEGIRRASIAIHRVDECRDMSASEKEDYKAQTRFLRAYFYWMLIKQYGPVPLIPDEGLDMSLDYKSLSLPRNTYDECVDFICAELEQAARVLPRTRSSAWTGQATKGAALATRAKVLLFAASPLYNGNTDMSSLKNEDGQTLISQEYSEYKWARAAAAAKEVIDLDMYELYTVEKSETTIPLPPNVPSGKFPEGAGDIDPFESYRECFNGENVTSKNKELIFLRQKYSDYGLNVLIQHNVPFSLGGWNANAVTLKQVNAYYMTDGQPINNSSTDYPYIETGFTSAPNEYPHLPANVALIYANREPRFYASIAYNGSVWENESTTETNLQGKQFFYYKGTNDGKNLLRPGSYLRTGIGIKKYYNPTDSWNMGGILTHKVEPTIRYADVLLWYAEALNELTQSYEIESYTTQGNIQVARDISEMKKAFSQVRFRAGLPDLQDNTYNNADEFRIALKRERQIELFLEAARYFDLRRWKDAKEEENQPILGYDIDMADTDAQRQLYYRIKTAPMKKVFMDKMYLWPIPKFEIDTNAKMVQNPGW